MTKLRAQIGYSKRTEQKPFFYANAHEKDFVPLQPAEVTINDAREIAAELDREGFTLVDHTSSLADLTDLEAVAKTHTGEIDQLLRAVSGADHIAMAPMGILRFSESAGANENHDNSHPARFVHVDMAAQAAAGMREKSAPQPPQGKQIIRSAQYNVWRVLSAPPQDVPLGLCDCTSLQEGDLLDCDAIFDPLDGSPQWGFPNYLLAYNPAHRWYYYANMHPGEALIFKTSDSDKNAAQLMPHGAFDNPLAGPETPPRISLEMRGTAYWFG